jgi:hypothetical protein
MRIEAFDPGKTVGRAVWVDGEWEAWSEPYDSCLHTTMSRLVWPVARVDVVVCEDFIISERTTKMSAEGWRRGQELEFIGALRWGCRTAGTEFVLQSPGEAKRFSTDAKLRRVNWWTRGTDHPRDASRHLLLYLARNGLVDPTTLVGDG